MRSRLLALALVILVALGLAGCSGASKPAGETSASVTATGSATTTGAANGSSGSAQMDSSNPDPATLLSVADFEKATGMTGIKIVAPKSSPDALGRLNFANADGTLVAIFNIGDGTAFDQSMQGMLFSELATGTGSMSFVGPSKQVSPVLTVFAAAQGDHAVIMRTFTKTKGGTDVWVPIAKLQELTGLALSRWK